MGHTHSPQVARPNLTILGSGFGAFSLLKAVDARTYDVVLISPRNHFLFTPLLPSTTVGTVEFRSIIEPIRTAKKGVRYYQASCNSIDVTKRTAGCESALDGSAFTITYDKLVIAVGAVVNTYGIPGGEEHAHFLKDGTSFPYGLLVWSTGNGGAPFVRSLPLKKDHNDRIIIDEYLRVPGCDGVYALGDCATLEERNVPATAQLAQQEGRYLARSLNALAKNKPVSPFRERNLGMLAYVGSNRALADLTSVRAYGFATWLFWRSAYFTKLVSLKNKVLVLFDWFKALLFGRDISRF